FYSPTRIPDCCFQVIWLLLSFQSSSALPHCFLFRLSQRTRHYLVLFGLHGSGTVHPCSSLLLLITLILADIPYFISEKSAWNIKRRNPHRNCVFSYIIR